MSDFLPEGFEYIPTFGKSYAINNMGKILSLPRKMWNGKGYFISKPKYLKQARDTHGYLTVSLTIDPNQHKTWAIHRLVAMTFLKNGNNKKCINHKDGIKTNNHIDNLEWCTYGENTKHAFKNRLQKGVSYWGINNPGCKYNDSIINFIKNMKGKTTLKYLSDEFGVSVTHVWAIQNSKTRNGGESYAK